MEYRTCSRVLRKYLFDKLQDGLKISIAVKIKVENKELQFSVINPPLNSNDDYDPYRVYNNESETYAKALLSNLISEYVNSDDKNSVIIESYNDSFLESFIGGNEDNRYSKNGECYYIISNKNANELKKIEEILYSSRSWYESIFFLRSTVEGNVDAISFEDKWKVSFVCVDSNDRVNYVLYKVFESTYVPPPPNRPVDSTTSASHFTIGR